MIEIGFNYGGSIFTIQCNLKESMKEIYHKFCTKLSLNIKSLYFLYNGKIIDDKLPLDKVINNEDKKRNKMSILVHSMKDKNNSQVKAEQIICPKCGENAKIKIMNYTLIIYGCKNNLSTENIILNQFEKTQIIDESKIICNFCKKISKDNFKNHFYFCGTCKKNLCPLCKDSHDKEHIIINYELKNYICPDHGDNYNSYCEECKKNICLACEEEHSGHSVISFGKILPKKDEIKIKINELKVNINKFKEEVEKIKNILNYVMDEMENYFKIIEGIYNSFDIKKRNYQILNNINEINNNNIIKDILEIINEENIPNKFYKINSIYNQMKNDLQKNLANNFNFNFFNVNLAIPMNPMNMNQVQNSMYILISEFNELKKSGIQFGIIWGLGFELWTLNNNPYEWIFTLGGIPFTPYSGGKFYIKAKFPIDYPNRKPYFYFVTPFYHINVNPRQTSEGLGYIDMAILNWWNPKVTVKIKDIIIDISTYFWGANPEEPYGLDRAKLMNTNLELFNKRAKYFTKKYADPSFPYKEYDIWDFTCPNELNEK